MPQLSPSEREAFLTEPGVLMRIATVRRDGAPFVTPIWFVYEEDAIWFTPRARSSWLADLRRDPRVALCVDEQPPPWRKVIVEGRAELVHDLGEDDRWRDRYRRIARRYVAPEAAEAYVQATRDQERALFRVGLARARVRSWRMPVEGEPASGIWHARYYGPGTRMERLRRGGG
ncbi:MAG: TIGR03618 family F420-dependent PPOX class oxidoreductase [Myxococcota bacterium]|nr:TIGR03618 family F420-dependent PPOX class oxidoreductase [Myxococcota bacterium]